MGSVSASVDSPPYFPKGVVTLSGDQTLKANQLGNVLIAAPSAGDELTITLPDGFVEGWTTKVENVGEGRVLFVAESTLTPDPAWLGPGEGSEVLHEGGDNWQVPGFWQRSIYSYVDLTEPDSPYSPAASHAGRTFKIDKNFDYFDKKLTDPTGSVRGVAHDPQSADVAVGAGQKVYIYDSSDDYSLSQTLTDPSSGVRDVHYDDANGRLAVGTDSGTVYVYDTADYSVESSFSETADAIYSVSWCLDPNTNTGYLATGNAAGDVYVYDATLTLDSTLTDATDVINAVAWEPQGGRLATGSADQDVRVYSTSLSLDTTLTKAAQAVNTIDWQRAASGAMVFGSDDQSAYVYDSSLSYEKTLSTSDPIHSVRWETNSDRLSLASGSEVRLYDTSSYRLFERLQEAGATVRSVFWEDDSFISGASDVARTYTTIEEGFRFEIPTGLPSGWHATIMCIGSGAVVLEAQSGTLVHSTNGDFSPTGGSTLDVAIVPFQFGEARLRHLGNDEFTVEGDVT